MASHLTEEALWASRMSGRLRVIQGNFADDTPESRQNYLTEEIDRGLKNVALSKRRGYLDALAEQFPDWQGNGLGPGVAAPPAEEEAPLTPEDLLARLIEMASSLSPEKKAEFGEKLLQAGIAVQTRGESKFEMDSNLQGKLGLRPGQSLDLERSMKMLVGFSELTSALDQLVWALWKQLAPRSSYRKESDFVKLMGPYLAGDRDVSTQEVAQPLERTRRLIAAFLGSVGRAGSVFAKNHVNNFAPEVIEDWARMEKKWNESLEFCCWRKYTEHYKAHSTEAMLESELQKQIVKEVEKLLLGRTAG